MNDLADGPLVATFAFVDLAGFSALTEVHGDLHAFDVVDRFRAMATESLGSHGRLLKMIGDEAFLVFPEPEAALRSVESLVTSCLAESGFPLPRAGIHHGSAVARGGDVVGNAVNVASRLASAAVARQVLCTADVALSATELGRLSEAMGRRRFRNLSEEFDVYSIVLGPSPAGESVDPVCRMAVRNVDAAARLSRDGVEVWFCSLQCAERFRAEGDRELGQ